METSKNQLYIDFQDHDQLCELMDTYGESSTSMMYGADPETEEDQFITINSDNIVLRTNQSNGWVRVNTFWRDGTVEETFDGRWDR